MKQLDTLETSSSSARSQVRPFGLQHGHLTGSDKCQDPVGQQVSGGDAESHEGRWSREGNEGAKQTGPGPGEGR